MSTETLRTDRSASSTARAPLPRTARRVALIVHIAASGMWLGLEVALGALVVTALVTGNPATEAACLQAIEVVAVGPMIVAGALALASGIVLGLGTKWGLLRYRWVAVKLVLNVVLLVLVLVALRPGAAEVAEAGRALAAGAEAEARTNDMVFPPIVSTVALSFAITLSVLKPWGRLRGQLRGQLRAGCDGHQDVGDTATTSQAQGWKR